MDLSIIIPTYNEAENLAALLAQVFQVLKDNEIHGEVIIVDDDSPDKTWELAQRLMKRYKNLRVVRRQSEKGLATAVLAGFEAASSPKLLVMDADLSHPPTLINDLYEALDEAERHASAELIAGHWERADDPERASRYYEMAATEAIARGATSDAARLLAQSLALAQGSI